MDRLIDQILNDVGLERLSAEETGKEREKGKKSTFHKS
ncbi:MAG: hypothetical protein PWQ91_482 [Eubacteriales bacterium]|nr:hypothetical protein [Eubacteriales bacterium]MDN5363421.1 hypothetical protein [Eubacteriales bacterium]